MALTVVVILSTTNAFAQATVTTLANTFNKAGTGKASTTPILTTAAKFNFPAGLALDPSGSYMFVADYNNNTIQMVSDVGSKSSSTTYSVYTNKSGLNHPVGVAVDSYNNIFVLNYGTKGANGSLMVFDSYYLLNYLDNYLSAPIGVLATNLINAAGLTLDYFENTYITVQGNTVIRVTPSGITTVVGVIKAAKTALTGIAYLANGKLAIADAGNNGIWLMDPANTNLFNNAVKFTGFHGANDILGLSANAAFNHPEGIIQAGNGVLVVADYGNNKVKLVDTNGSVSRLYGVNSKYWKNAPNATKGWNDGTVNPRELSDTVQSRQPFGLAIDGSGNVYDTEDYYDLLREATGTGLLPPPPPPPQAPNINVTAGYGVVNLIWTPVNTATNYNVKRSTTHGTETTIFSTTGTNYIDTNVVDNTTYFYVVSAVNSTGEGINSLEATAKPLYSPTPTNLIVTATNYTTVSLAWAPSVGATSYNIKRSTSSGKETTIGNTIGLTYTDAGVSGGTTYYYIVSAINPGGENPTNSTEVSVTVPIPPPPAPTIGWFDFEGSPVPVSTFHAVGGTPYITYNNINFAIEPNLNGVTTVYTTDGSNPSATNGFTAYPYQDGLPLGSLTPLPIAAQPDFLIKAVNINAGGSSAIVTSEFQFLAGTPIITGNNAAQFTIFDVTAGAQFLYTTDGSDPRTNANASIAGPSLNSNGITLSLQFPANTNIIEFQIAALKQNYQTSSVAIAVFSSTNFVANTISFGFASGEASSVFLGSPGQTFYAPVTLTTLPGTIMYSLQFNLTVTNVGAATNISPGAFGFQSMLEKPIPGVSPVVYEPIPPAMFAGGQSVPNPVYLDGSTDFSSLLTTNYSINLLGVGWVERAGATNLYNTLQQTLITYSQAHDDLFPNSQEPNEVIVGGYSFIIPSTATNGQQYQIQIGRPSATSDSIGVPGSSIYIAAPTNGSTAGGSPISAFKYVTVTNQIKYLVGDVYPFGWFNAGDFGSGYLVNADVQQVFQSAVYHLNSPPLGSDFFDAMDSCGNIGVIDNNPSDPNYGYYTNTVTYPYFITDTVTNYTINVDTNGVQSAAIPTSSYPVTSKILLTTVTYPITYYNTYIQQLPTVPPTYTTNTVGVITNYLVIPPGLSTLFDGNDTNINQVVFGDGILDVSDVYMTYRRSLDPSLLWFDRFWNNGQLVADNSNTNHAAHLASRVASSNLIFQPNIQSHLTSSVPPKVVFTAGNTYAAAGSTVSVPITANISGSYPLRLLMLNLSVLPTSGGAPVLTTPVQFNQTATQLGTPYTTSSIGNGSYAAVWLNNTNTGVAGTATLGTLSVSIPSWAPSGSTYTVNFDHASASPNGLASFPKLTVAGTITVQ